MLIFIYGEETYLSREKLAAMRARFQEKFDPSGMNLAEFEAGESALGDVVQAVQSAPFLGKKRMVILKGLLSYASKKADAAPWLEQFEKIPESTIVIIFDDVSVAKAKKHALVVGLETREDVYVYPFIRPEGPALEKWAAGFAKERALVIDRAKLSRVVQMVGLNLWQLAGELEKLAAYSSGYPVTDEVIELLVRGNSDDQMFVLMDAVSAGDGKRALGLLRDQRRFGTSEGQLFGMLARQVRLLLGVRAMLDEHPTATQQDIARALDRKSVV